MGNHTRQHVFQRETAVFERQKQQREADVASVSGECTTQMGDWMKQASEYKNGFRQMQRETFEGMQVFREDAQHMTNRLQQL